MGLKTYHIAILYLCLYFWCRVVISLTYQLKNEQLVKEQGDWWFHNSEWYLAPSLIKVFIVNFLLLPFAQEDKVVLNCSEDFRDTLVFISLTKFISQIFSFVVLNTLILGNKSKRIKEDKLLRFIANYVEDRWWIGVLFLSLPFPTGSKILLLSLLEFSITQYAWILAVYYILWSPLRCITLMYFSMEEFMTDKVQLLNADHRPTLFVSYSY